MGTSESREDRIAGQAVVGCGKVKVRKRLRERRGTWTEEEGKNGFVKHK